MTHRFKKVLLAAIVVAQLAPGVAWADNPMGYKLQPADQAASLPRSGGSLGMRVGPARRITSSGLTFQLLKVERVNDGSPAAQAGLREGDDVIAVDGRVFPNTDSFAAYVGSITPGHQIQVDYVPAGGGPDKAQRVGVTVGEKGHAAPRQDVPKGTGLSTGEKVAIGVGAAAIIGCYKYDCVSRLKEKLRERQQGMAPQ